MTLEVRYRQRTDDVADERLATVVDYLLAPATQKGPDRSDLVGAAPALHNADDGRTVARAPRRDDAHRAA